MARGDLIERQWTILEFINAHGECTRGELAQQCGISIKTIKRDMDVLCLYFPLQEQREGNEVRYAFTEGYRFPQVTFSFVEALGLLSARELWQQLGSPTMTRAVDNAIRKIKAALPDRVADAATQIRSLSVPSIPDGIEPGLVQLLTVACRDRHRIRLNYHSAKSDAVTTREMDPYTVALQPPASYLIGFCHLRNEVRVLHLARISDVEILSQTFNSHSVDVDSYLHQGFGAMQGAHVLDVKVHVNGTMARVLKTNPVHSTQKMSQLDDDSYELTLQSTSSEGVVRWLLSLGSSVRVLEPAELVQAYQQELAAMCAQALPTETR